MLCLLRISFCNDQCCGCLKPWSGSRFGSWPSLAKIRIQLLFTLGYILKSDVSDPQHTCNKLIPNHVPVKLIFAQSVILTMLYWQTLWLLILILVVVLNFRFIHSATCKLNRKQLKATFSIKMVIVKGIPETRSSQRKLTIKTPW